MKIYMLKDVEKIGLTGEIVEVKDGLARNLLIPKGLAQEVTKANEKQFADKRRVVDNRKQALESKTSMLAEKIANITITLKRKMHDDERLYGAISQAEIAEELKEQGISITKSQVVFDKKITGKGSHKVTIKLSSTLKPVVTVKVIQQHA